MSVVVAVRYLAEFAAEALRPWDPSRELAARLLADLPLMVALRKDDDATADEVTHLVLGRFAPAEPPAVEGADYLPTVGADWSKYGPCAKCKATAASPCVFLLDGREAPIPHRGRPLVEVVPQPSTEQVAHGLGSGAWGGTQLHRRCLCGETFSGRNFDDVDAKIVAHAEKAGA